MRNPVAARRLAVEGVLLLAALGLGCARGIHDHPARPRRHWDGPYTLVRVVDGDTLVASRGGRRYRIRLIGVDTPELHHSRKLERDVERTGRDAATIRRMGRRAKHWVEARLGYRAELWLEYDVSRYDRYGRRLAYVWYRDRGGGWRMLNEELLRHGYAQVMTVPPNVRYQRRFLAAERAARRARRGFWAEE